MTGSYSVGIPVRNEAETLEDCIDAILSQTVLPKNIYVCLNGSDEKTIELAQDFSRQISYLQVLNCKRGKANAWNRIVGESSTNNILFTDGDAYLESYAAEKMLDALESNPHSCVTGGDRFYLEPPNNFLLKPFFKNQFNRIHKIRNLSGMIYMIKRKELLEAGNRIGVNLLDEDILNEDALIGAVARSQNRFVKSETYGMCYPVSSMKEYVHLMYRLKQGYRQLEDRYPQLFFNGQTNGVSSQKSSDSTIYYLIKGVVNFSLNVLLTFDRSKPNTVWRELKGTKIRRYS